MVISRTKPVLMALFMITTCFRHLPLSIQAFSRGISVISDLNHQNEKPGTYRALIVGIYHYQDPKIPDLETAVNDAQAMANLFRERCGLQLGPSSLIKFILERKSTRERNGR